MARHNQIGQLQFGQNQFNGYYDVEYVNPVGISPGKMRVQTGFGTFGNRGYLRPEQWEIRPRNISVGNVITISLSAASGALIGKIRSDSQETPFVSLQFTNLAMGGCSDFILQLSELPKFPLLDFAIITIALADTTFNWYKGIVSYPQDQGTQRDIYEFRGVGFLSYLKQLNAFTTYPPGTDYGDIVRDLALNWIIPYCPIMYNASKIETTGVVTGTTIELTKMTLDKVLSTFALSAGCYFGVDGDGELYFKVRSTETNKTFFCGYDFNEFRPSKNLDNVYNVITAQRQQGRGSGGVGWSIAGVYNDAPSIKKYGRRAYNLQLPGYFTDADADAAGNAFLAQHKEPKFSADVDGIPIRSGDDFFQLGNYRIIMPFAKFAEVYNDCDDASQWAKEGSGDLSIGENDQFIVYGSKSIALSWNAAFGDVAVLTQAINIGKIDKIKFYLRASKVGNYLRVGVGRTQWDENTTALGVVLAERFYGFEWDVSSLDLREINKFGIEVLDSGSNPSGTILIDRIEFYLAGYKYYTLEYQKAQYKIKPNEIAIDAQFGDVPSKMENYLAGLFAAQQDLKFVTEVQE